MHPFKHIFPITIVNLLLSLPAHSSVSPDGIWSDTSSRALMKKEFSYRTVNARAEELVNQLRNAPLEGSDSQGFEFFLPLPNGEFERVSVFESPIMAPELAAKLPELKTYKVSGLDNPHISGRLDASPEGFHGFLNTDQGVVYIEPESSYSPNGSSEIYRSFNKSSFPAAKEDYKCTVIGHDHNTAPLASLNQKLVQSPVMRSSGTAIRTYRLALAATAEYTAAVSSGTPTIAKGQAAIVTAINRINAIYEKEVAIKFTLVDNSDIVFTNAATDGYTNNDGRALLDENKTKLDTVIKSKNYDIGHVFSTGGGGIASLASVCDDEGKAQGVTGSYKPVGDPFVVDYVAHEIGHQFGAPHTFNAGGDDSGACDDSNRENHRSTRGGTQLSDSAYEPGSGTTIMAYAGICNPQNIQNRSDPYFHARSLEQIREFVENEIPYSNTQGGSCGTLSATGNTPPTADAGDNYTLPANTPFALTGTGDDVDNADVASLNYTWEQFDLGSKTTSLAAVHTDADTRPIVRSRMGTSSPTRYIPALDAILENNLTKHTGERLPTTERDMKFRLTVRSGTSGFNQDDMTITVDKDSGPLIVTAPVAEHSFAGGSQIDVRWDVANTHAAPVNCSNMAIHYSTDGGENFSETLLTSTPNDGFQQVTLPNTVTNMGRIKVQCVNNIFFNVSPGNFSVSQPSIAYAIEFTTEDSKEGTSENTTFTYNVIRSGIISSPSSIHYTVAGAGNNPATANDFVSHVFPSGTIDFAAGEATKIIRLNILADTAIEADENFTITLSNADSASNTLASTQGTITNDDQSLAIYAIEANQVEGNSGNTAYTYRVQREGDLSGSASARYAVTGLGNNPADAADFTGNVLPNGNITFAAGETSKTMTINVLADTALEADESFMITLSDSATATITMATANGFIKDDDVSLAISSLDTNKAEGNVSDTIHTFSISRTGDTSGTSSVRYTVSSAGDNSAAATDFVGSIFATGSVDFSAGQTTKTIAINVLADDLFEADEVFTVTLSNPISASIAIATATGIIKNDDASLSIFSLDKNKAEGNSGSTAFNFNIVREGDTSGTASVYYLVNSMGNNPTTAADFIGNVFPTGSVDFAEGESNKTITIAVAGDTSIEEDEGFSVSLLDPTSASISIENAAAVITNDDSKAANTTSQETTTEETNTFGGPSGGSGGLLFGLLLPLLLMRRKRS